MKIEHSKIRSNKAAKRIRKAVIADTKEVSSAMVREYREKIPGSSLHEALERAKFEAGALTPESQDELIRALLVQVHRLTEAVVELQNRKQSW